MAGSGRGGLPAFLGKVGAETRGMPVIFWQMYMQFRKTVILIFTEESMPCFQGLSTLSTGFSTVCYVNYWGADDLFWFP